MIKRELLINCCDETKFERKKKFQLKMIQKNITSSLETIYDIHQ